MESPERSKARREGENNLSFYIITNYYKLCFNYKYFHIFIKNAKDAGYEIDLTSPVFYTAPGCLACMGLGYKGRVGIYEVFTMNKDMAKEIESGVISEYRLQVLSEQQGMITMAQDGLVKAAIGLTSVEEVLKVAEQKSVDEQLATAEKVVDITADVENK